MPRDTAPRCVPGPAPASRAATRPRVPAVLVAAVVRCAGGSRRRLAVGALLLGGLSLVSTAAGAQRVAPAIGSPTRSPGVHPTAADLEEQAAARVAAAVCSKRVVLLGELPEHGEAHGFGVKARVVERLVARCGFHAVLFEAGSYDFFGLERAIATTLRDPGGPAGAEAGEGQTDSLELALARAIGGLWWTRELAGWRQWLVHEAVAGRVVIGGLDDQPSATAAYARATLPSLVGAGAPPARAAAERGAAGTPDRDVVMAQHLAWWSVRLPRDAKIVVWTAATHAARAPGAHPMLPLGVLPLGARLAERWGDQLAVIGFTALRGQWSRAGRPSQPLAPLPLHALEARALAAGAAGDAAGWAYLDWAALRSLGSVPSRLFGKITTTDWSTAFDGVLVIRDETAPTFEPRR